MTEHEIQQFKSCGTDQKLVFMLIHHNLIFPDVPQEEVLEDLLPPVVAQDSNYTFSESEIEPENSTNDDDLPEILLGPRNVTAYLGNVKLYKKESAENLLLKIFPALRILQTYFRQFKSSVRQNINMMISNNH